MKDRIRMIRKEAGLTQDAFADRIGAKKFTVVSYESGKRVPSGLSVRAIAKEFNVSETWLLTGEGDMRAPVTREQEIAQITAALYEADPDGMPYKFMKALSDLKPETWKDIGEFIKKVASEEE